MTRGVSGIASNAVDGRQARASTPLKNRNYRIPGSFSQQRRGAGSYRSWLADFIKGKRVTIKKAVFTLNINIFHKSVEVYIGIETIT